MSNLGVLDENGWGIAAPDYASARSWYGKAAAAGNTDAMVNLGLLDENGTGTPAPDYAGARGWYEKAAAAGNATAMVALAALYIDSKGVGQDFAKAADLLAAADKAGAPRDALRSGLTEMSWRALLARQFDRALDAGRQALAVDPSSLMAKTNIAHALMYLGRTEEARAAYLAERGKAVPEHGLWEDVIRKISPNCARPAFPIR